METARFSEGTDKYIGARIRKTRIASGLTQQRLGQACGISFQQVQKYETGKNRVSAAMLLRIAAAMRVPLTALVPAADGDRTPAPDAMTGQAREEVRKIAEHAARLPARTRAGIAALVSHLARTEAPGDTPAEEGERV